MTHQTVKSTCCYCGVGCGVLIESDGKKIIDIKGDPDHPANLGRLCTKGLTLPLTTTPEGRALYPELRRARDLPRERVEWDTALDTIAARFADIVKTHGPDSVAFYLSGQLLTEDYYVFNKLGKALVTTNNVDTNSRLCMSSAVSGYKLAFGVDGPPTNYEDLEHADVVIIAGANMAYAHPVLFRRLEAAKAARPDTKWIVIDPRRTDTAASADLHLAIEPGTDVALFNGILHLLLWEGHSDNRFIREHTNGFDEVKKLVRDYTPKMVADVCGITEADLIQAATWFGNARAALSLYCMGLNQSSHGTDKNVALINLHLATGQLGRPGAGPFSLTGQPNAMGGREVGGLATMLAAHRDIANPVHRAEMEAIWGVDQLSSRPGKAAVAMFDALKSGEIKAVWIACTNPVHSLPDADQVKQALKNAEFVVVQEAFADTDTVAFADVVLPAVSWGEKEGTVTNSERRISRVRKSVEWPGEARADWWIANEIGKRMERLLRPDRDSLFTFNTPEDVFNEYRTTTAGRDLDITGLSYDILEAQGPQQWPYKTGAQTGAARLYTDFNFETEDGKARFQAVPYLPVAEKTNSRYPYHLLTGRLRDQWHGMSRTGRVPQLFEHAPEPVLHMHANDMQRRGFLNGDLVKVENKRGHMIVPVAASDEVKSSQLFFPMHWNGQFMSHIGVNLLTTPAVDPTSQQPELKHAAVRLDKVDLPWQAVAVRQGDVDTLIRRLRPLLADCAYASIGLMGRSHPAVILRVAHPAPPTAAWLAALDTALDLHADENTQDYQDEKRGVSKRARWDAGKLTGLRLAGETAAKDWLLSLMRENDDWTYPRQLVFAPRSTPPAGASVNDRVVCNCLNVKESAILQEIAAGCTFASLQDKLKCGTSCGSCVPELKRMIATPPR